jgi:hypothetical protein
MKRCLGGLDLPDLWLQDGVRGKGEQWRRRIEATQLRPDGGRGCDICAAVKEVRWKGGKFILFRIT